MILGALAATRAALAFPDWPAWAIIPFALMLGFMAGAFWGFIPGALKAYMNVNEILTTIMLNAIAVQMMNYLLSGPLMDPVQITKGSFIPQTARFSAAADLPRLVPTRLHAGVLLAIMVAILVWVLLWRTTIGFRIRAVGLSQKAARRAGIRVERYAMLALIISGALAGLAAQCRFWGSITACLPMALLPVLPVGADLMALSQPYLASFIPLARSRPLSFSER